MTDWNKAIVLPTHIATFSGRYSIVSRAHLIGGVGGGSANSWNVANQAAFIPIRIPFVFPVRRVWWINGTTVGGHADFGIYTASGSRIYSTGSILTAGASALQYVTPTTPFLLGPGDYYFAWNNDGTTNRAFGWNYAGVRSVGLLIQASAFPLPDPAIFAQAPATTFTTPFCGITRTASGF